MLGKSIITGRAALIGFAVIAVIALGLRFLDRGPVKRVVKIGGESVVVEVAATPEARAQGLSGRNGLVPGTGMLFVFPQPGRAGFWMKDMRFPIDIIWIENDRVVDIAPDVPIPPATGNLRLYYPREPSSYVLEVPAGFSRDHELKITDPVEISI